MWLDKRGAGEASVSVQVAFSCSFDVFGDAGDSPLRNADVEQALAALEPSPADN